MIFACSKLSRLFVPISAFAIDNECWKWRVHALELFFEMLHIGATNKDMKVDSLKSGRN